MQIYRDIDGDSGVEAYEIGSDFIRVQFRRGKIYRYTSVRVGAFNIRSMHRLAEAGNGLNAFINSTPVVKRGGAREL